MNTKQFQCCDERICAEENAARLDTRDQQTDNDEPELPAGYRHVRSAIEALLMS
jgi:hypothetical protein